MQVKAKYIEDFIISELDKRFQDRVDDFTVTESTDTPYTMVSIEFKMYNYFYVIFNYDRGSFGCAIINGEHGIDLESSEKWFDKADFDNFFSDLKEQIELRIPDKYLEYYGWK